MRTLFTFLCFTLLLAACSGTQSSTTKAETSLQDKYNTLSDAVRALPGVQVIGGIAKLQGATSLSGDDELKFVAKGRVLGGLAATEGLYALNDIKRLRLIRPATAAQEFGNQASSGAVELVLK